MAEVYQQERENESGMDNTYCQCRPLEQKTPELAAKNMAILKGFDEIFGVIKGDKNVSA